MIKHNRKIRTDQKSPTLDMVLEALTSGEVEDRVDSTIFYGLSGLTTSDLERIRPVWDALDSEFRVKVMRSLADISETNFELDYRTIGLFGLEDDYPEVRTAGIEVLWENESIELMDRLIDLALEDADISVRAAAASELGRFVLLGELGNLPDSETVRAQEAVISLLKADDEDIDVRRRALEAIANSSHEIVTPAIEKAYSSYDQRMRVSAVFAMGRSCDERWEEIVLQEMGSPDPEMRYEAARACGELTINDAIPYLLRLTQEADREIKEAAIWSIGEIGGTEALRILMNLAEEAEISDDQDLIEAIEDAIGNASLIGRDLEFDD